MPNRENYVILNFKMLLIINKLKKLSFLQIMTEQLKFKLSDFNEILKILFFLLITANR